MKLYAINISVSKETGNVYLAENKGDSSDFFCYECFRDVVKEENMHPRVRGHLLTAPVASRFEDIQIDQSASFPQTATTISIRSFGHNSCDRALKMVSFGEFHKSIADSTDTFRFDLGSGCYFRVYVD